MKAKHPRVAVTCVPSPVTDMEAFTKPRDRTSSSGVFVLFCLINKFPHNSGKFS